METVIIMVTDVISVAQYLTNKGVYIALQIYYI